MIRRNPTIIQGLFGFQKLCLLELQRTHQNKFHYALHFPLFSRQPNRKQTAAHLDLSFGPELFQGFGEPIALQESSHSMEEWTLLAGTQSLCAVAGDIGLAALHIFQVCELNLARPEGEKGGVDSVLRACQGLGHARLLSSELIWREKAPTPSEGLGGIRVYFVAVKLIFGPEIS